MTDIDIDAIRQREQGLRDRLAETRFRLTRTEQERDEARAKVDELTAALAQTVWQMAEYAADNHRAVAQLTAANRRADGLEADLRSANTANTTWANQRDTFRAWDHCGPGGASNPHPLHPGKTCEQYDQPSEATR